MRKSSDSQIIDAYDKTGSVWKAAELLGMCGQSVHERLVKLNVKLEGNGKRWGESDTSALTALYERGFKCGDGQLDALCKELGRTKQFISRKAKELGLTKANRDKSDGIKSGISKRVKRWHNENEHPKGYKGKKHSDKTKDLISRKSIESWESKTEEERAAITLKQLKSKENKGNLHNNHRKTTWKQGWREIGGTRKYYRSRWEANYARYLEFLKINGEIKDWKHEPDTFWFEDIKRGVRSYLPDFKIYNNDETVEYHEVKGWMDSRSKTKIKRMKKYYPEIKLVLIQKKEYDGIRKTAGRLIEGWE